MNLKFSLNGCFCFSMNDFLRPWVRESAILLQSSNWISESTDHAELNACTAKGITRKSMSFSKDHDSVLESVRFFYFFKGYSKVWPFVLLYPKELPVARLIIL